MSQVSPCIAFDSYWPTLVWPGVAFPIASLRRQLRLSSYYTLLARTSIGKSLLYVHLFNILGVIDILSPNLYETHG